jgi:predicted DNA-binding protein with PD1-like motif
MIQIQHVNPTGIQVFMGTLTDGVALHKALAAVAREKSIKTATFDLLGGLSAATFTAYDFTTQTRHPPQTLTGALEIVSGHGTISQLDGEPHVHIHVTLAFRDERQPHGIAVVGGHLADGKAFAVELTLTSYLGNPVQRKLHVGTGLQLWELEAFVAE